jgi:hypothetical protein
MEAIGREAPHLVPEDADGGAGTGLIGRILGR